MRVVRQQLKEQERQADDERYIKNKTQDENEQMNKTNSLLQQQIDELSLQLIKVSVTPNPQNTTRQNPEWGSSWYTVK